MRPVLLALALIMFSAYAIECSGSVSMGLPAVNEGDETPSGEMVDASMHLVEGDGNAYIAVDPNSDGMLQQSIDTANLVARREAGAGDECDILVEFEGEDGGLVSGPSGGAAFALMAYSLLSGEELRGDAAITGAIAGDGTIIPVGGLYEKALSAKVAGKEYLITPMETIDEKLMLSGISGIEIYEVADIGQAADFFADGMLPPERELNLTPQPLPALERYRGGDSPAFGRITAEMIEDEREAASGISDAKIREYFETKILRQEELLEKGYYYSAANDAFLDYILADSLASIENPDVESKMNEVSACIAEGTPVEPTYGNYEWVMGADARMKRAENQLKKFEDYQISTKEENYYAVYELNYALAWCEAGSRMYAEAEKIGGEPIDELALKELVDGYLEISENYTGIEESENYQNGLELYEEGRYAGALHEVVYALSFQKRDYVEAEGEINPLEILDINSGGRKSMWSRIFQAHTEYLLASNDTGGAYATALFSYAMEGIGQDLAGGRIVEELSLPELNESGEELVNGSAPLNASTGMNETGAMAEGECPPPPLCSIGLVLLALPLFPLFIKKIARK